MYRKEDTINSHRSSWLLSISRKGAAAVIDQGIFALANFSFNILLIRFLPPDEYGLFVTAFSVILLLGTVHTAYFIEPMLVYGSSKYYKQLEGYLLHLVIMYAKASVVFGAIGSTVLWIVSRWLAIYDLEIILASIVSAPMVLFLWLARRAYYVRMQFAPVIVGGIVYIGMLITVVYIININRLLSPSTAIIIMGLSSALVGLGLVYRLVSIRKEALNGKFRDVAREHWEYARWSIPGSLFTWVPSNLYYVVLPLWSGVSAGGVLKALMNLVMPALQANAALALFFISLFSSMGGRTYSGRSLLAAVAAVSGLSGTYGIVLYIFRKEALSVYGSGYSVYEGTIPILIIIPVLTGAISVIGAYIRAMNKPQYIFWAYLAASAASGIFAVLIFARLGVTGGLYGTVIAYSVLLTCLTLAAYRLLVGGRRP